MRKLKRLPFWGYIGLIALAFTGCASIWQPVPGELTFVRVALKPPSGWMRLSTPSYEMFSKDGPYLQYIFVQQRPLDQPFQYTRQRLTRALLPHEAAEIVVDNLRSDPQIKSFELLAVQPATLDGRLGFKLLYTHRDRQGVAIRSLYYGIVIDSTFFNLRYTAAQRHYYEEDLETFERMLGSLRLSS